MCLCVCVFEENLLFFIISSCNIVDIRAFIYAYAANVIATQQVSRFSKIEIKKSKRRRNSRELTCSCADVGFVVI